MAGIDTPPCRRIGNFPEPEMKTETTEDFSPDILHVFMGDQDSDTQTIFSHHLDSSYSQESPPSFPRFQALPPEIRWIIWEAALPEPAVVPRTWNNSKFRYILQREVPAVLQACSESRRLLIPKTGRPPLSVAPKYELVQARTDEGVYMNWRSDSVWIYRGYDIGAAEIDAYANMEKLVMNWGLRPCWLDSMVDNGVRFTQKFPRLRLLTLLVDFSEHGWPEPSTLKGLNRLKRNEVKRIWGLVQKAFREAKGSDPSWSPPVLHIVHRTANWSRQEAK